MAQSDDGLSTTATRPLCDSARGLDRWLDLALLISAVLLIVGWTAPIMTIRKLYVFREPVSIFQALGALLETGDLLLFAVIGGFTVLIPAIKLCFALHLWHAGGREARARVRALQRLEFIGRWSMIDVFLIALTVAALKISLVADVHIHWGLYALIGAILLSMVAVARITVLARGAVENR